MKWMLGLMLGMTAAMLYSGDVLNLFTGKQQLVDGEGSWQLTATHGRVLAMGVAENGKIIIDLPKMDPGTVLDATLQSDKATTKVKLYSPEILTGVTAGIDMEKRTIANALKAYGVAVPPAGKEKIIFADTLAKCTAELNFLFTEKNYFPMNLSGDWQAISLCTAKISGSLGVILNKEEQIADINGSAAYLELKNNDRRVIVLAPEFNLSNIEDVLLIKQTITKEKGK